LQINGSLVDELINSNGDDSRAEAESEPSPESLLHQHLSSVEKRIKANQEAWAASLL
jgi:hypothetical protein